MKKIIKIELNGTVVYQKEGKVDRVLSTSKEIKKALREGALVECYWVGGAEKIKTYKAFAGLIKNLKKKEREGKKNSFEREVTKKIEKGVKLSEISNLISLNFILDWMNKEKLLTIVRKGLDDIGLLKIATWSEVNDDAEIAEAWLKINGPWFLKANFNPYFKNNFKRGMSLEKAIEIAKVTADRSTVCGNIGASKNTREDKEVTRIERIKKYLLEGRIITNDKGFPMINKRSVWEKISKDLGLKKETRVEVSRTLGAFRGKDFDLKESISFELKRKDQNANGLALTDFHLGGGPVTLYGVKRIKKIFLTDAWTEYENGELVSAHEKTYGQSFRDRYVVDTMTEANFIMEVLIDYNEFISYGHHYEIITEGAWLETPTASVKTDEFVSSDEDVEFAIKEAVELTDFLESLGVETKVLNWHKDEVIEAETKAELSFKKIMELDSLIPANSKISLWD